ASGDYGCARQLAATGTQLREAAVQKISSGSRLTAAFSSPNGTGNLIVAYVVWDNSSPVTISDSAGNVYLSAVGPTKFSGDRANSQIFYAKNIRGGTTPNSVTATFSSATSSYGILYIHEYSGADPNQPLDAVSAGTGSSSSMNSGSLVTSSANDLLFAGSE